MRSEVMGQDEVLVARLTPQEVELCLVTVLGKRSSAQV